MAQNAPPGVSATDSPAWRTVFSLLRDAGEAKLLFDSVGTIAFASGALANLVGTDAAAVSGRRAAELPTHWGSVISSIAHQTFQQRVTVSNDVTVVQPNGQGVRISVRATPMVENGEVLGVGVTLADAAAKRMVDTATRGDFASALTAAAFSPFASVFLDARGACIATGGPLARVTGLDDETARGGGWMRIISTESIEAFRRAAVDAQRVGDGWRIGFRHANGQTSLECAAGAVLDPNRNVVGYVVLLTDSSMIAQAAGHPVAAAPPPVAPAAPSVESPLTSAPVQPVERYRLPSADGAESWSPPKLVEGYTDASRLSTERPPESELEIVAISEPGTDKVTGLPNRVLFAQHVAATIERIKSDALTVAVSFVDLQGVRRQREIAGRRPANDSLFLLAKRLESTIRSIEIAGIVDQDVFAVLSINWLFAEDLPIVARRLLGRLEEPLAGRDGEFVVDMRLGMSIARPTDTVDSLFSRARSAMASAQELPDRYFIEGL